VKARFVKYSEHAQPPKKWSQQRMTYLSRYKGRPEVEVYLKDRVSSSLNNSILYTIKGSQVAY